MTFKYEWLKLCLTIKVNLEQDNLHVFNEICKVISDCTICYNIRPGAAIDSISNIHESISIDKLPNISKYNIYWFI